ncbi:MAG: hypothetical protein IKP17_08150 [Oscillospiraceae bacterium]|jgi:hypothetical protein|nr:hypothetical protein [Oscillospiraceae bacterium]
MADEKFDPSKMPPFDPSKFDPSKMPPFDPSKMPAFDPSKMPAGGFPGAPADSGEEEETTAENNILRQPDPAKWLRQPPKKMRGDMRRAMKLGNEAEKYNCTCWNKNCPFYGNCRKCIVFHMALKQIPTCQREMVIEMYTEGYLPKELYIED